MAVVTALAVLAGAGVAIAPHSAATAAGRARATPVRAAGPSSRSCRRPHRAPPAPKRGGSIVVGVSADLISLDPATAELAAYGDGQRMSALYDPLVVFTQASGTVTPQLAKSLTTTDGARWTLELRPNVTFSDGTPLDAAAVKFNWERLADPTLLSLHAQTLKGVTLTVVDLTHPDDPAGRARPVVRPRGRRRAGLRRLAHGDEGGLEGLREEAGRRRPVHAQELGYDEPGVRAESHLLGRGADKAYLDQITFKVLTPRSPRRRSRPARPTSPS
ncbi:ABC transporter substrate-binding protein [Yinghuangia aomiensis]